MDVAAIIEALRAVPMRAYDDLAARSTTAPPKASGFYAWWQTPGALPGVTGTPHGEQALELLYVGIAPRDSTSKSHLRKRLANHHRDAIGSSTFRFDLAAFLWRPEGWRPFWTDRAALADDELQALADWQRRNLSVQWIETTTPWDDEPAVVRKMLPPLNRAHNESHPSYFSVGVARDGLRATARTRVD